VHKIFKIPASYHRRVILKTTAFCLIGGLFSKLTTSFAQPKSSSSRNALVIGNSTYSKNSLLNPINDAKAMEAQLSLMGFQVNLLLDTNLSTLNDEISKFALLLERNKSIGLFYYAGHGVQLNWSNYLVPVDAQIGKTEDIQQKCYELNKMLSHLTKASNPMNIIILDACRDNPFGKSVSLSQKGLNQFDAPPGSILSYATAPGNVANDGIGKNGLFTENLLKEMRDPDAKIEDVFKRVRLNVRLASKGTQIPWESTSLEQDFYFNATRIDSAIIERKVLEALAPPPIKELPSQASQMATLPPVRISPEPLVAVVNLADESRKKTEEQKSKQYEVELKLWNEANTTRSKEQTINYIKLYPNGSFCELAQAQLDEILKKEGEKKILVISSPDNKFSEGSSSGISNYTIADSFRFEISDILSQNVINSYTNVVTRVTDELIEFDGGARIIDRLGNDIKSINARFVTPAQLFPSEYSVGKKWSTRFRWVRAGSYGVSDTELHFKILKRERLNRSIGDFNAFYIEGDGHVLDNGAKIMTKMWIDPDKCPQPLVFEWWGYNRAGRYSTTDRTTLVAYEKKA
jgi:hypothetical protein